MNALPTIQLIGIGNIDRSDDGIGQVVAQRLAGRHPEWRVLLVRLLLPEQVAQLDVRHPLIFIDAALDIPAGEVQTNCISDHGSINQPGGLSHQLDPVQFVALLRLINSFPPGQPACQRGQAKPHPPSPAPPASSDSPSYPGAKTYHATKTYHTTKTHPAASTHPATWSVRIGIHCLEHGSTLSSQVASAIEPAIKAVESLAKHPSYPSIQH